MASVRCGCGAAIVAGPAPRLLLVFLLGVLASAAPLRYEPKQWNRSCNYTASSVPASLLFKPWVDGRASMFPLNPAYHTQGSPPSPDASPVREACFGPGEPVNHTLIAAGLKMPCGYSQRSARRYNYWEENVCPPAMTSNCYCYALDRADTKGYCMPGLSAGQHHIDYSDCSDAYNKVVLDGGRPVSREAVYGPPPLRGHFIALVIWRGEDFHFFRRDADGTWSQKKGDTLVTNTYPNGTVVTDVEDPAILGAYRDFCGYFHTDPETHNPSDSGWTFHSLPERLAAARRAGERVDVQPLPHPSAGWARLSYPYLLFGLDAAVFEAGARVMPWQGDAGDPELMQQLARGRVTHFHPQLLERARLPSPAAVAAARGSSDDSSSSGSGGGGARPQAVKPHWLSRTQSWTSVEQREQAVRQVYRRGSRRQPVQQRLR